MAYRRARTPRIALYASAEQQDFWSIVHPIHWWVEHKTWPRSFRSLHKDAGCRNSCIRVAVLWQDCGHDQCLEMQCPSSRKRCITIPFLHGLALADIVETRAALLFSITGITSLSCTASSPGRDTATAVVLMFSCSPRCSLHVYALSWTLGQGYAAYRVLIF